MSKVSFYNLNNTEITKAVPKLLEKIYDSGERTVFLTANDDEVKKYDDIVWSYSTKTFIPHATSSDEFPEEQFVYITSKLENPNNAKVLFSTNSNVRNEISEFDKYFYVFSSKDKTALEKSRKKYLDLKNLGFEITYYIQDNNGNWSR